VPACPIACERQGLLRYVERRLTVAIATQALLESRLRARSLGRRNEERDFDPEQALVFQRPPGTSKPEAIVNIIECFVALGEQPTASPPSDLDLPAKVAWRRRVVS
jgi:hypothetical protein